MKKLKAGDVVVILKPAPYVEDITGHLVGSLGIVQSINYKSIFVTYSRNGCIWFYKRSQLAHVGDVRG